MKEILEELGTLGGVCHGCIVKDGHVVSTTFPALLNDNLALIARITERVFKGADSVERSYNEIYFELDENYLLGYPLESGMMVLLLTGKDVNFALIHMTVQSARPQIASALPAQTPPSALPESEADTSSQPVRRVNPKIDPSMKPVLNEILKALTLQIGPVARIIMGEALKKWRISFEPVEKNIPALINILAQEIDDELAKQEFLDDLERTLQPGAEPH